MPAPVVQEAERIHAQVPHRELRDDAKPIERRFKLENFGDCSCARSASWPRQAGPFDFEGGDEYKQHEIGCEP
jgi:hypothetical protein